MRTQPKNIRLVSIYYAFFALTHFLLACGLLSSAAHSKPLEKALISIEGKQMGALTRAEFKKTRGDITLNQATLDQSKLNIEIETSSLAFPSPLVSDEIKKPEWLNVALFPKALFESTKITKKSDTELDIQGTLTIKDVKKNVRFPVQFSIAGKKLKLSGEFEFKRLDFNIGKGEWGDTSIVSDPVKVRFETLSPL